MADTQFFPNQDGQEISLGDYQLLGVTAGLASDRLLAALIRLAPFDGTNVAKAIMPYGNTPREATGGATTTNPATVASTGSANGSVVVNPFRAVVGSRTTASTSPTQNWNDIRSSLFVGASALAQTVALNVNSSGNARWDLIYVTVLIDQAGGTGTRRVKSPITGVDTATSVTTTLTNPPSIQYLPGTPSGTPTIPALPADTPGTSYNIAVAAVYVPNGFGLTSTVANKNIRDLVPAVASVSPTAGGIRCQPASGNNDMTGTYGSDASGPGVWSSGVRPGLFLPPSMVGIESRLIQVDLTVSGHPSHSPASVIDDTIDWRNRFFFVAGQYGSGNFATTPGLVGTPSVIPFSLSATPSFGPLNVGASSGFLVTAGSSMYQDSLISTNDSTVFFVTPATVPYGIYVDQTTGYLKWYNGASPAALLFWIWLFASAQMLNQN